MIKQFDDNSYIEIKKHNGKVLISIAAQDADNSKSVVINAAEVTLDEFNFLLSDITEVAPAEQKSKGTTKKKTSKKKAKSSKNTESLD